MLLPALSKAREKARAISCTNNMKQIGLTIPMYANNYNNYVLPATTAGSISKYIAHAWPGLVVRELGASNDIFWVFGWFGGTPANDKIFICPSGKTADASSTSSTAGHNYYGLYYRWGSKIGYMDPSSGVISDTNKHKKFGQIVVPSSRVAMADGGTYPSYTFNTYSSTSDNVNAQTTQFSFRHGDRINLLMLDGHVESCSTSQASVGQVMGNWTRYTEQDAQ